MDMMEKNKDSAFDFSSYNDVGNMGKFGIYARRDCKKCFGRGWVGTDTQTKQRILCSCLIKVDHEKELEKLERKLKEMKNE
jgi:hypothetical protein